MSVISQQKPFAAVYNDSDNLFIGFKYIDGRLPAAMEKKWVLCYKSIENTSLNL